MAQAVNQRTHELGVRVALGASSAVILRMVFAQGMRQMAIGLAIGLSAAFGVTRAVAAILVGVSPTDPVTFFSVALVLTLAAVAGCVVDPRLAAPCASTPPSPSAINSLPRGRAVRTHSPVSPHSIACNTMPSRHTRRRMRVLLLFLCAALAVAQEDHSSHRGPPLPDSVP